MVVLVISGGRALGRGEGGAAQERDFCNITTFSFTRLGPEQKGTWPPGERGPCHVPPPSPGLKVAWGTWQPNQPNLRKKGGNVRYILGVSGRVIRSGSLEKLAFSLVSRTGEFGRGRNAALQAGCKNVVLVLHIC